MKSLSLCALPVLIALTASPSHAVLIASDSFATTAGGNDYAVGSLAGQSPTVGATGFLGAWKTGTAAIVAQNGGLSHSLTPAPTLDGEIAAFTGTGSASRRVGREINYTPTDGKYFLSVLLQKNDTTNTRDIFAGLGPDESATTSFGGSQATYIGIFNGGISFTPGGAVFTQLLSPANVNLGETYFALLEIDFSTTGADTVTASVYNGSSALVANQVFGGLDLDGDISRLSLATSDFDPTVLLDEVRFGTELSDVLAVPEPSTLGLLAVGTLGFARRRRMA